MNPGLPHHRRGPRIDERRDDPAERNAIRAGYAVAFVLALLILIAAFSCISGCK
jgi:hypothetical protein